MRERQRAPGRPRATPSQPERETLDDIFAKRYAGAANVRGIRYQTLYALLRAFDLYGPGGATAEIVAEGIEDVDIRRTPPQLGRLRVAGEYVQVKSREEPWSWARLREPLEGFLPVHRADPSADFRLVVDFALRGHIASLARYASAQPTERARLQKAVRRLCGSTLPAAEAAALLDHLTIDSISEADLRQRVRRRVTEAFELGSEAVEIYIGVLADRFLDWARARRPVTRSDLEVVRSELGEALARESHWQAYGRGLINRVAWEADADPNSFLDGRRTRPGHISLGLDVRRPTWLERIDRAVRTAGICVLRSSSGQGKSALLFRYAFERWAHGNTFELKVANTPDEVEQIRSYLRHRHRVGLPTLLLIDNAAWETSLWPLVAQDCAALAIPVLVSIRNEDWYRFARNSLANYEVLEPSMDLAEARDVFEVFRRAGRLHESVRSAEWAYEQVGEPHLLMEYVYLLTHGRMLEDLLRDQLRDIAARHEDPAKLAMIRLVALADALGAPVVTDRLLSLVPTRDDEQQLLLSLAGEYVELRGGFLMGLHPVRSEHLTHLLHDQYPNPAATAITVFDALPVEAVPAFVANALNRPSVDADTLRAGLIEKASGSAHATLAILDGVSEAGERTFFDQNRALFDEAFRLSGNGGPLILAVEMGPFGERDLVGQMIRSMGDQAGNFLRVQEILSRAHTVARGLDFCRTFLQSLGSQHPVVAAPAEELGRLLDWCGMCGVDAPDWVSAATDLLESPASLELPVDHLGRLTLGLYRLKPEAYQAWFNDRRDEVLAYLRDQTDSLVLDLDDEAASLAFLIDGHEGADGNELCVSRLRRVRPVLPFCGRYRGDGTWLLPAQPTQNPAQKDIPRENLPSPAEEELNRAWVALVRREYAADGYYRLQESWNDVRRSGLDFVAALTRFVQDEITGRTHRRSAFGDAALVHRFNDAMRTLPEPPAQMPKTLRERFRAAEQWQSSLDNVITQVSQRLRNPGDDRLGRLAVYNAKELAQRVTEMHGAFAALLDVSGDHFDLTSLDTREAQIYPQLADLLDAWILNPPRTRPRNVLKYVRDRQARLVANELGRVHAALRSHGIADGRSVVASNIVREGMLRYVAVGFEIDHPAFPEADLEPILHALADLGGIADFFVLVPLHRGARISEEVYQLSANQIDQIVAGKDASWEGLAPRAVPDTLLRYFPTLPLKAPPTLDMRKRALALTMFLPVVGAVRKALGTSSGTLNRFDRALRTRHLRRIGEMENELAATAARLRSELESVRAEQTGPHAGGEIERFFAQAEARCRAGTTDVFADWDNGAWGRIFIALDELFRSAITLGTPERDPPLAPSG